jgi:hypothetical protein
MVRRSAANALALMQLSKYKTQAERNALKAVVPLIPITIYNIAHNIPLNQAINYLNSRKGVQNLANYTIRQYLKQELAAQHNRSKYALGKASIQLARLHNLVQRRRAMSGISSSSKLASTAQVARRLRIINAKRKINKNRNNLAAKYKNIMRG